jgi:hypothetical protein
MTGDMDSRGLGIAGYMQLRCKNLSHMPHPCRRYAAMLVTLSKADRDFP